MVILRRIFFAMVLFLSYINNTFLGYSKLAKVLRHNNLHKNTLRYKWEGSQSASRALFVCVRCIIIYIKMLSSTGRGSSRVTGWTKQATPEPIRNRTDSIASSPDQTARALMGDVALSVSPLLAQD